jgi:sugar phosphate isomerase/epimerase
MKMSFSTLACPDRTMPQIMKIAVDTGYNGIELRSVEGQDSLWKLAVFSGAQLAATKSSLADSGLSIPCVDTSCRFHSPDSNERKRWITEGQRMSDLAAELGAKAIRVFGDTIQPGGSRDSTRSWIAESVRRLAEGSSRKGVEVWLETHGDFCAARETAAILSESGSRHVGVVWDPVNTFIATDEKPTEGAPLLGTTVRHVHVKDFKRTADGFRYVLTGEGEFPLQALRTALRQLRYDGFLSFEWEKKWHPELADADVALPHFANWFRKNCAHD